MARMYASPINAPSLSLGELKPCLEKCQHDRCITAKMEAGSFCYICKNLIGYNVYFFTNPDNNCLVHNDCWDTKATPKQVKDYEMALVRKNGIQILGNTYPVKDQLASLGCKYDPKVRCWYAIGQEMTTQAKSLVGK